MEFVSFQIPARNEKLQIASKALRDLLKRNHVDELVIDECDLALCELLNNIVKHAYDGEKHRIEIRLGMKKRMFFAEVEDDGLLAAAKHKRTGAAGKNKSQVGPYEMARVGKLMHDVKYQYRDEKNFWVISRMV